MNTYKVMLNGPYVNGIADTKVSIMVACSEDAAMNFAQANPGFTAMFAIKLFVGSPAD